jgi:hypothetical protein
MAAALRAAAPAAAAGSARFEVDTSCAFSSPLPAPAWLGLCTPLPMVSSNYALTVQLTACAQPDATSGGSVSGVAYYLPKSFAAGQVDACTAAPSFQYAFTATPGACVQLFPLTSRRTHLRLAGAPTCAPAAPASVFILETFDARAPACSSDALNGHQALAVGACVAGGFLPPDAGIAVNVSVAALGTGALRVTQYDASAAGCSGAPSAALAPLPDLPLPAAGSAVGACSSTPGNQPPSFRLLAPVVMPSASATPSGTASPTFSRGASPSASPTTSATVTPTLGSGSGSGSGSGAALPPLPFFTTATIVILAVSVPVGLALLVVAAFALRRLSIRSITWSKDAETVIVQSPMRPSIYRPTVKLPDASINSGSSAKKSTWGYA